MNRILFLCTANICRSPAAHCVFQHLVDQAGRSADFEIESAGSPGFQDGCEPDPRMQAAMRARGIPIIGRSRRLRPEDFEYYDLIIAMDNANISSARQLDPGGRFAHKLVRFGDYCTRCKIREIPDPYRGGDQGFEQVLDLIEDGCAHLLQKLTA